MKKTVIGWSVLACMALWTAEAAEIVKQDNTEPLNTGASWVGGNAPTAADVAVWNSTVAGANASALAAPVTWNGIKVTNPGGPVTITGSDMLSFSSGGLVKINMAAATQNLTLEVPVTVGAMTNDVTGGRVLTFAGPVNITSGGNWGRTGWGTVVFDNVVASAATTTLELQRGTNIFTGKNGGLSFTSTASGARIYVGRYSGSVATLIISNGVHEVRGIHSEASANFVGVGSTGTLIMEGGSLTLAYLRAGINSGNGYITVNNGLLEVTAGSNTADLNGYGMMLGNQHTDGTDKQTCSGAFIVNGGAAVITNGIFKLGSKNATSAGTLAVGLNGGVLAVRRFYVDGCPLVPKTFTLNGGTLLVPVSGNLFDGPGVTNGSMTVLVGNGGAVIDTGAASVTNTAALLAAGDGGLTKLGTGTLTLRGTNTYTGRTRVQAGMLRFAEPAAALVPDLAVMSRAGLSLADGALTTFSPSALVMGTAVAASSLELELASDGAACDVLAVPAGATLGRIAFAPVTQGTTARAKRVGDYVVMTYAGNAPDTGLLTVSDPAPLRSYSFILDEQAKTVTLRIEYAAGESEWIASGSGAWETAGNWTVAPASAAGTTVRLGDAITAPATVTASAPVTLGGMTIDNLNAYTLAGGGFTFDNGASAPYLAVARGAHGVSAPLTLAGALSVAPASGAIVTLGGVLGGSGQLVKDGAGEAVLTQPNSYTGGTLLKQGPLLLGGTATLGSGPVTVNGGSGFRVNASSPLTLGNDIVMATSMGVNTMTNSLTLTGAIDWLGGSVTLAKSGVHELALSGTGSETALSRFTVDNGRLVFKAGANFALMNTQERDTINMRANNTNVREVELEAGSQVTVSGVEMEYGASNTVRVSGGRLRLLGGSSTDAVAMRGNGVGVDRFIVDVGEVTVDDGKWFGVGFRTGDAHLIVNGGTTTLSRVSLGARDLDMDLSARGFVNINGGLLEVTGNFGWMGSSTVGRTNIVTLGNGTPGSGVWRTCATANPRYERNNMPIMRFNGGTLETRGLAAYGASSLSDYLNGAKQVYVDAGGARVDTKGQDVAIAQPLQKGSEPDGGLTKLGAGRLALTGACGFTGATVVEEGVLTLPASYASASLTVATDAAVNLANGSIQTFSPAALTLQNGSTVVFEALADGSACDQLVLPEGAAVGDIAVVLLRSGTPVTASAPGDYPVFAFSGSAPDVGGWTLVNPPQGRTASFEIVGGTVVVRIAYAAGVSIWTQSGSGDWETAGNWNVAPADAAGTAVRFDGAVTAAATVTRASGSTAGSVAFNSVYPYTLAGAALTLEGVENEPPVIGVEYGAHAVQASVVLAEDAAVRAAAGAAVALNGGVSGSATLTVEGPGTLSLPDATGLAVDGLALTEAGRLTFTNSTVLTLPVALGAGGGVLAPAAGTTLDVESAVTGAGDLFKDGSSVAVLTNANAGYTGVTGVRGGTLRLDTLPAGGVVFGQGTLHYVGGGATVAGGYTLDTGDDTRAGVLRADGDITFEGNVGAVSGALVKTGAGTVSFTAPGLNVFNAGNGAGTSHNVLDIGAFGDSPTTGFSGFNIADGKVVIGAVGQTNLFNGILVVGLNTTTNDDAETAGQLDVTGGKTEVTDALIVGRSNGTTTTAPVARTSRLRVTGGELSVQTLVMGRTLVAIGHNSAPETEISGGQVTAANAVIVGEQYGSVGTLKLSGGTLTAPNIVRNNGQAHLLLDGGVFRPSANGQTMSGLTSAKVGAGGALLDLSLADNYTLTQVLTTDGADGGLTKTGAGTLVVNSRQLYEGPTLVSEGTLRIPVAGGLSNVTALTVSPGAALELDTSNTQTVSVASLTLGMPEAAPVSLTMAFRADGTNNDRIEVSGAVTLGEVAFTIARVSLGDEFGVNGTYTVMTYTGSDPSVAGLSVVNPLYGKRYVFAAASGAVTVTIETDYTGANGGAIWNVTGGGNWFDAGNWLTAPDAGGAGQQVRFDDKITAPATVTLGSAATVGEMFFNNTNAYTVAGAAQLSLDNGSEPALLSAELGSHTVAVPVAVPDAGVVVQAVIGTGLALDGALSGSGPILKTTSGGSLSFGATGSRTGTTTVQGGDLIFKDGGNVGSGELVLDGAANVRVRGTAPSVLSNPVTLKSGNPIIQLEGQALTLSGALNWQTGVANVYKWGTNDLVLAGTANVSGTPKLFHRQGGLVFASGANYTLAGNTRESIKMGLNDNIKSSMTIEDGATLKLGGILTSATATGSPGNDITITQNGGSVELTNTSGDNGDAFFLRDWGAAPATYVMNGGTFTMPQTAWANLGYFGPALLTVNGGEMTLGRVAAGARTNATATGNGWVDVTVNGGRLTAAGSWSWMSDGSSRRTEVTLNGGTLALPVTRTYGAGAARWTNLKLNGGILELTGVALDATDMSDYLAGLRRVTLGSAGGVIDTRTLDVTVRQNVLALDNAGGLAKTGPGSLTLPGTNTLWGMADVQEGTLRARFTHRDLPATPFLWLAMDSTDSPDVSGNGHVVSIYQSGLTVTNRMGNPALWLDGAGSFSVAYNTAYTNIPAFTASAWIYVTANAVGSDQSIISARPSGDKAFELKLNGGDNRLRLLQHSNDGQAWWQDIRTVDAVPLNQWVHVAAAMDASGLAMYINGVKQSLVQVVGSGGGGTPETYLGGWPFPGYIWLMRPGRTGPLMVGRTSTSAGSAFKGGLDDVMLFERILSDAEVAQLAAESPVEPLDVRVGTLGTLDLLGETARVSAASGNGQVVNGTLAVKSLLAPGDAADGVAGAVLSVQNLTLGTNVVYACTRGVSVNDLVDVGGLLTVDGAGVIDFGRTAENPITSGFTTTVMTYGSVSGAANFADWKVTGLGRKGYAATVSAVNGEVKVSLEATFGTVILMK